MFKEQYSVETLKTMDFGYLQVVGEAEPKVYNYEKSSRKARMMYCDCKCGKKNIIVSLNNLLRHHTLSCGCYKATYSKQFLRNYVGDAVPKIS